MAIEVTDELVEHIANLSRLALSAEERGELKEHFHKILDYIKDFQALDTSGVDPSHFSIDTVNVDREDEIGPSLPTEKALDNAPQAKPPHFVVPKIVDVGGGGA